MSPGIRRYQRCLFPNIPENVQHAVRDITNFVLIPLDILLATMSLVVNIVVLAAVVRTRSLQHPSILLLCSLSVTDLLWAVFTIVRNTLRITHDHLCPEQTGLEAGFVVLCVISTLGNLAIISKDRHLAVSKPWWYRSCVKRSRVVKKTTVLWIFSAAMAILVHPNIHIPALRLILIVVASLFHIVCIVVMISSYVGILIANRRHRETMHLQRGQMLALFEREKKLANTVGLILIALFCTFLPALLSPLILAILGFSNSDFIPFRPFYSLFITLNGLLNPLLNYGRNEDVRKAVRGLIRRPQRVGRILPQTIQRVQNNSSTKSVDIKLEECSSQT